MTVFVSAVGLFAVVSGLAVAAFGRPKEGAVPSGLIVVLMGLWLLQL